MKKEKPVLQAEIRTITGKKVKQLRKQGLLPSSIYGKDFAPLSIQVNDKAIEAIFADVGESGLVEIILGDQKIPVLFKNPQYHPVSSNLVHIDCHKVNLKEKIIATVPVELIGESLAVKNGNVLMHIMDEVEVEALPSDLPEKIEVDISSLIDIDNMISVADLIIDKTKVEIKNSPDQVVVKIEAPKVEEEPVVAEAVAVDVPATAQKTEEEKAAKEKEDAAKDKDKE